MSSDQSLLVVPHIRLKMKGDCAFEVVAPNLWICLPVEVKAVNSVDIFEKHLIPIYLGVLLSNLSVFNVFFCYLYPLNMLL